MISVQPPIRGLDNYGSGAYHAPRGRRLHNGIDLSCMEGSMILSPNSGEVTKIGWPYSPADEKKGHLRYVQITERNKYRCRYFYVFPIVSLGDDIRPGDVIGIAQGLTQIYPGITDHIHYEVIEGVGKFINPEKYLRGEI